MSTSAFGVVVRHTSDELVLRNADFPTLVTRVPGFESCTSLAELFSASMEARADAPALGQRALLGWHLQERPGKSAQRRRIQGPSYDFISCRDAFKLASNLGAGLRAMGVLSRGTVAILADTSPSWYLAAQGAFLEGFTVATVYTSLGAAGIEQALRECDPAVVLADAPGVAMMAASSAAATAKRVVLLPPRGADAAAAVEDAATAAVRLPARTPVRTLRELADEGARVGVVGRRMPDHADIALLMYTSGSTGTPKGVLIQHSAALAAVAGLMTFNLTLSKDLLSPFGLFAADASPAGPSDVALAYLPLAHIFEFTAETAVLQAAGVRLGYGSPSTLSDASPGVAPGTPGDARALRPSFVTSVPAVLERIAASVTFGAAKAPRPARALFSLALRLNTSALTTYGVYSWGCVSRHKAGRLGARLAALLAPALGALTFRRARAALGGRVRFILSGGAPLAPATQSLLQVVFGCPVLQGYGLTETCCAGTLTSPGDTSTGRVGAPIPSCFIKLVAWEEGGYRPSDRPRPRGELHIGGPALAAGYLARPELSDKDFYRDAQGMRWFRTGDIGEVDLSDGVLRVVDRKKDLVKLPRGEYLSLAKVEGALVSQSSLIEHVMVLADSGMRAPAALAAPHVSALRVALRAQHQEEEPDEDALLRSPVAQKAVLEEVRHAAQVAGLEPWEVPVRVRLVPGPWTPESGLVTAALKVRRQHVRKRFASDCAALAKEE